jgi:hypothetical protein
VGAWKVIEPGPMGATPPIMARPAAEQQQQGGDDGQQQGQQEHDEQQQEGMMSSSSRGMMSSSRGHGGQLGLALLTATRLARQPNFPSIIAKLPNCSIASSQAHCKGSPFNSC